LLAPASYLWLAACIYIERHRPLVAKQTSAHSASHKTTQIKALVVRARHTPWSAWGRARRSSRWRRRPKWH
jgi:hypothetical protein